MQEEKENQIRREVQLFSVFIPCFFISNYFRTKRDDIPKIVGCERFSQIRTPSFGLL